jgi:hypothetical protein
LEEIAHLSLAISFSQNKASQKFSFFPPFNSYFPNLLLPAKRSKFQGFKLFDSDKGG